MKDSYILLEKKNADAIYLRKWLWLSVSALAVAGLFAILLVTARTPGIQNAIPITDMFHTALVIHVNLSVLVWMLCFAALLWQMNQPEKNEPASGTGFWLALAGVIFLASAPFIRQGSPLLNNYIPVYDTTLFLLGVGLFLGGIGITLAVRFYTQLRHASLALPCNRQSAAHYGIAVSGVTTLIAFLCLYLSHMALSPLRDAFHAQDYYDLLFWGIGHVLQFTYTQIMLIAWLWLMEEQRLKIFLSARVVSILFTLNLFLVIPCPLAYLYYEITSYDYLDFFTQQMRYGGGIAAGMLGLAILAAFSLEPFPQKKRPQRNALLASIILFGVGGIVGFLIKGSDTQVPAHYHGSIVGISLALMGLAYSLLPRLGYRKAKGIMAEIQPWLYGGGQLLHIIGLAWSGGYGALRKTPGAVDSFQGQAAMGLMGMGGLLSIIGGLLFVLVMTRCMWPRKVAS